MKEYAALELATLLNGKLEGSTDTMVSKIAKLDEADQHSICFIANLKYAHQVLETKAAILIAAHDFEVENKNIKSIIRVDDAYAAFAQLLSFYQTIHTKIGIENPSHIGSNVSLGKDIYIGAFSYIGDHCKLGNDVQIFPTSYIGDNCEIGENTTIHAGVKIYDGTIIGNHCIIHAGAVIGSDGFGFVPTKTGFQKVPQTGIVTIGNKVEIGANTVIDKATMGSTTIKDGAKLDNLIHIAHNVEIGEHSAVAAQTGISGSTKVGKGVLIGGQVGIVGHITIGDGAKINAQSGISKSVEKGKSISGSPATDFREHYKQLAWLKKIPDLIKKIDLLENRLKN